MVTRDFEKFMKFCTNFLFFNNCIQISYKNTNLLNFSNYYWHIAFAILIDAISTIKYLHVLRNINA